MIVRPIVRPVVRSMVNPVDNRLGASWDSYWNALYYILKSGAIWYKRETNTAGGYFKLHYSSDSGGTWEELMSLDLTEESVIIDLDHEYTHQINGTAYEVLDGEEVIYST